MFEFYLFLFLWAAVFTAFGAFVFGVYKADRYKAVESFNLYMDGYRDAVKELCCDGLLSEEERDRLLRELKGYEHE